MKVAVVTNEPWGTYHLRPLLGEAAARPQVDLVHLCPSVDGVPAGGSARVEVGPVTDADVIVVTGLTEWPQQVLRANPSTRVVASCLAYMNPEPVDDVDGLRHRIGVVTAAGAADGAAFVGHLGVDVEPVLVGTPALDSPAVPSRAGHVLVLTSVTRATVTGGSAPGTDRLLWAARTLTGLGYEVVVRPHPREDLTLWADHVLDASLSARDAAAGARFAVGIPGTAFAEIAAEGVPLIGVVDPALRVPAHLLSLLGATITPMTTESDLKAWAWSPTRATEVAVKAAVGPVGAAAQRLLDVWMAAARTDTAAA
jgi:hypothetical protein